jgi:hypothetical protein
LIIIIAIDYFIFTQESNLMTAKNIVIIAIISIHIQSLNFCMERSINSEEFHEPRSTSAHDQNVMIGLPQHTPPANNNSVKGSVDSHFSFYSDGTGGAGGRHYSYSSKAAYIEEKRNAANCAGCCIMTCALAICTGVGYGVYTLIATSKKNN